ncbi:MAG: Nuclease precursor [Bacteroidetes bacterium ADurb.Bin408]|nr:MAG: Nuclease precursor [Bacteroidetes bacterium ADurb.Bin408]
MHSLSHLHFCLKQYAVVVCCGICMFLNIFVLHAQEVLFAPACTTGELVKHSFYSLCYDEYHEQALWVAYMLTAEMVKTKACERSDNFRPDPLVSTGSAIPADYKNSGYDRGHLCPAADMHFSCDAMSETFYMSNMSPQVPSFNRGIWSRLEEQVRRWAEMYDTVYVVTAGVLDNTCTGTIGQNVAVPGYFYKALLRKTSGEYTCIAFLLPNTGSKKSLTGFIVSMDNLEKVTGIDFFPALPDSLEDIIEKQTNKSIWNLKQK